jgi:hypothetical protein
MHIVQQVEELEKIDYLRMKKEFGFIPTKCVD